MGQVAIRAEGISKQYRIGIQSSRHDTLYDVLTRTIKAPFQQMRRLSGSHISALEEFMALKDVSFEIGHGEVVGIVGRNGSGKSTLLKILSRITQPTTGRVELYGRVGSLLEVGTGFHPELTGRENIYMNGAILGMKKAEIDRKFDEIVAFAEVEKFLDTPVKRYSSGMYVRLAFAVAAHLEPEILLVDEVLAVGDVQFQKKCLGKMKSVAGEGRTVLFVSHNMQAVRSLCSRCILLTDGNMIKDGTPGDVLNHYMHSSELLNSQQVFDRQKRPGTSQFKINSVKLKNTRGDEIASAPLSEDTLIEINFEVVMDNAGAQFSVVVHDGEGNCVLSSLSNCEENYYGRPMKKGNYRSTCTIYKNLLNDGMYIVTLIGGSSGWIETFRLDQVILFNAVDDGIIRRDYYGNFSGCIRPDFRWETRIMDEAESG